MTKASYQVLKNELDELMANLQQEDLDVDEAVKLYKRGLELVKQIEDHLKSAENNVKEVKAKFNNGAK